MSVVSRLRACAAFVALAFFFGGSAADTHSTTATITMRDRPQTLRLYGPPDGRPIVVSSGDGGWVHLAPRVAEFLAARGYFVVGFDSRAYLACFTSRSGSVSIDQVPGDYAVLTGFASERTRRKPVLAGVSEGAGLSLLAASDGAIKSRVSGVLALGVGDHNELGWRWRDAIIYVTKGKPDEPWFSLASVIDRVSPLPIATLNSTHDEFVADGEVQSVMAHAREPKRLWLIPASDHRFSDAREEFERGLLEALAWIDSRQK
jgi:pimeloyl-ACP methyl ester carboxylesterase